jgi:hypothetical protein
MFQHWIKLNVLFFYSFKHLHIFRKAQIHMNHLTVNAEFIVVVNRKHKSIKYDFVD